MNKDYVTQGKPNVAGAIYAAPSGTTLPTSATATLTGFESLGYISEDGVTVSTSFSSNSTKAWGGDVVLNSASKDGETFKFKLLESTNPNVLKLVYGDTNVTGTLSAGIALTSTPEPPGEHAFVIDEILKGGYLRRTVIPCGTMTSLGDIVHKDNDPIGYEATITAATDSAGNLHYEYIAAAQQGHGGN